MKIIEVRREVQDGDYFIRAGVLAAVNACLERRRDRDRWIRMAATHGDLC
jgi:hypothetical protein